MATAPGLGSQDTKLRGAGCEVTGTSAGGVSGGGAAAVAIIAADSQPAPGESHKGSNDGVFVIPLDPERRRISPKTKKVVLPKLGAATKADDDTALANTATEEAVSLCPGALVDKPAISAPIPPEQRDSRTSPSALTPSSDLEKKQRRAERFGLDLQISESEKRTIRAARFGAATGTTDHCTMDLGTKEQGSKAAVLSPEAESEKRKARAARFGSNDAKEVKEAPVAADVGKKKARAARFGVEVSTDAAELEKRKARAARFGSSPHGDTASTKKPRMSDVGFVATV